MVDSRNTRAGREWAAKVIKANPQCVHCGHAGTEKNPLQADHIIPVSADPSLSLDLTNGQTLCRECNIKKSNKTERKRVDWYDKAWLSSIA